MQATELLSTFFEYITDQRFLQLKTSSWSYECNLLFRDLERKIVEAEMDIRLAKSQSFLKERLKQPGVSSSKKLLVVIGVYTGFGSQLNRNVFRGSWMPKSDSLKRLEERGTVIRFVIGRRLSTHIKHLLLEEGAVVRAEEKVRVKDAEAEAAAIKEATEKESTARKENHELLAYINILQLQLQRSVYLI